MIQVLQEDQVMRNGSRIRGIKLEKRIFILKFGIKYKKKIKKGFDATIHTGVWQGAVQVPPGQQVGDCSSSTSRGSINGIMDIQS